MRGYSEPRSQEEAQAVVDGYERLTYSYVLKRGEEWMLDACIEQLADRPHLIIDDPAGNPCVWVRRRVVSSVPVEQQLAHAA